MTGRPSAARLVAATLLVVTVLPGPRAFGHGAVHERIEALTRQLQSRPNDSNLLAKRGELHALDENWTQAAEDFAEALELAPNDAEVMHRLADARLHLGDANAALRLAEASLAGRAGDPRALLVRARAHDRLGSWQAAVDDLSRVIATSEPPSPETYVERARVQERGGAADAAVAGLRDGVTRLGPLVTLLEPAIDIEARRGRGEAAIALLDQLDPKLTSTPRWLARRGELDELAGRREDARRAYRAALDALDRLPESRRRAPRQVALRVQLEARLAPRPAADEARATPASRWGWWPALGAIVAGAALGFTLQKRRTPS